MEISGRALAQEILDKLKKEVETLEKPPHLAVVLVGDDSVWQAYVRQKVKRGEEIGAKVSVFHHPSTITQKELIEVVKKLDKDPKIDGIIVQRPLPSQIKSSALTALVNSEKDVDGFHPKSAHPMPVTEAVIKILEEIRHSGLVKVRSRQDKTSFHSLREWLGAKKIVVLGKGETGGGPIVRAFKKMGITPQIIDSKTPYPEKIVKKADVIISCVGKPNVVAPEMIKKGVILVSVGIHKGKDEKFSGDYNEEKIKNLASFYTPTPGGVGPLNVACLLENLVKAAEKI